MNGDFLTEALEWITALEPFKLLRRVLIKELVDAEMATANLDHDLVTFYFDMDAALAEGIDAGSFAHEHDLKLLPVRVIVDVLS